MSDEEYAICPYNSGHKILRFRMPGHIVKCQANYKGPPLQICAYNATHRVLPSDMAKHLLECKEHHYFHQVENEKI